MGGWSHQVHGIRYARHWKGGETPEQSVAAVQSVIANSSIEKGNGGDHISYFGNKAVALSLRRREEAKR
jgi:hypothetical protein